MAGIDNTLSIRSSVGCRLLGKSVGCIVGFAVGRTDGICVGCALVCSAVIGSVVGACVANVGFSEGLNGALVMVLLGLKVETLSDESLLGLGAGLSLGLAVGDVGGPFMGLDVG